ncbi:inositol monophosphatase [Candidatus Microgenomates bacterium]|nr:inositol monophosphatase [Candidatus Microgenomates bacterium]
MAGLERDIIPRAGKFLRDVARREVGPRLIDVFEKKTPLVVMPKSPGTRELTTSADRNLDDLVREKWEERFPDIPWYSEDVLKVDPRLKGLTPEQLRRFPALMIVDIVDGSGNLARYDPNFCTSFALVMRGRPVLAVVYQPIVYQPGGMLWTAEEGQEGAFGNDQPISVSKIKDMEAAKISTAHAWDSDERGRNLGAVINRLELYVNQTVGKASSVLDGVDVARGTTDAHASFGLKPWDMAGFYFLITKAGGEVTGLWRDDWTPFQLDILASNGLIHDDLREILNRGMITAAIGRLYRARFRGDISRKPSLSYRAIGQIGRGIILLSRLHNSRK